MAEYWKVTHRHRPYNIIPVAFYVTLEGKIPRTPILKTFGKRPVRSRMQGVVGGWRLDTSGYPISCR